MKLETDHNSLRIKSASPWAASITSTFPLVIALLAAAAIHRFSWEIQPLYAKILLDVGINIILAVSLNIVNGFTGQFSIGHAGFMAVGGYTAAAITYYGYGSPVLWGGDALPVGYLSWTRGLDQFQGPLFGWGDLLFLGACVVGGLVAAVLGLVVGLPSLRLRGDYLAIVTLGFGEIVRVVIEQTRPLLMTPDEVRQAGFWERFAHLGGALGFTRVAYYTTHFWVWLFAAFTLIVAFRLRRSSYGRALLAIRENQIAAEAMGVPITRYKVMAFVLAAFFAGIAGALFAHQVGVALNPSELGFQKSFDVLIMVVLGGLGSISGSVLAAGIITLLPEVLRDPPSVWPGFFAAGVLIFLVRRKRGLRLAIYTVAAGIALEIFRQTAIAYQVDLPKYRLVLYALSLILIMILRPQGLLGTSEVWDFVRFGMVRRPITPAGGGS